MTTERKWPEVIHVAVDQDGVLEIYWDDEDAPDGSRRYVPESAFFAEIQERLGRYLRGDDSLAEFEAWLISTTWDISRQPDRPAHELATAIGLRIAEFTNGDWTKDELWEALAQLRSQPVAAALASGLTFSSKKEDNLGEQHD